MQLLFGFIDGVIKEVNDFDWKWYIFDEVRNRVEWEKIRRKRENERVKEEEEEVKVFVVIDW